METNRGPRLRNHSKQTSEKQKSCSVPSRWNFITATHHVTHQSALLRMSRPLASQQVASDGSPPTPGSGISELLDSLWPCFRTSDVRYSNGVSTFYTLWPHTVGPDTHPENVILVPNSKSGYRWLWRVGPRDPPRIYPPPDSVPNQSCLMILQAAKRSQHLQTLSRLSHVLSVNVLSPLKQTGCRWQPAKSGVLWRCQSNWAVTKRSHLRMPDHHPTLLKSVHKHAHL